MLFNSIEYLIFLPVVVLAFYLMPRKLRHLWLLIVSYYFYMSWNPYYAILIGFSTFVTYISGMLIGKIRQKELKFKISIKLVVALCLSINLGILFFYKYLPWILNNIGFVLQKEVKMPFSIILPVGISFYTFQALSYTLDVYRGRIEPQFSFVNYALYVSFFPQLVAGPIERSENLLPQINEIDKVRFDYDNMRKGLVLIFYGFFLKLVISDRASILVNSVFDNYRNFGFIELVIAAIMFAFQILCDFNGYSIIAKGSAKLLGVDLMDNFKQPYLALGVRDFWRKWHISLSSWFTDYLYIPLGGNRKGISRTLLNTMIVFTVSGLWHGASWNFVVWGLLHGIFVCLEILTLKGKKLEPKGFVKKALLSLVTFILVDFCWIFFRADSMSQALNIFRQMILGFRLNSFSSLGLKKIEWIVLAFAILLMFIIDLYKQKKGQVLEYVLSKSMMIRWAIYLTLFWIVLIFGVFGVEYDASKFIYFQF